MRRRRFVLSPRLRLYVLHAVEGSADCLGRRIAGGALLSGLSRRIGSATKVPCRVAERPIECVALGTGKALEDMETYGELIQDYRKPLRYDFRRG